LTERIDRRQFLALPVALLANEEEVLEKDQEQDRRIEALENLAVRLVTVVDHNATAQNFNRERVETRLDRIEKTIFPSFPKQNRQKA